MHTYDIDEAVHQPERDAAATAWWHCPTCGKLLGKIIGEFVYFRHGRNHSRYPLPIRRRCPGCGEAHSYPPDFPRPEWQPIITFDPRDQDAELPEVARDQEP